MSGHVLICRQRIINYCERAGVHYIVGLARNARLQQITEFLELAMKDEFGFCCDSGVETKIAARLNL